MVGGCRGDSMERPPTERPTVKSRKVCGRMAGALAAGCQWRSHPGLGPTMWTSETVNEAKLG